MPDGMGSTADVTLAGRARPSTGDLPAPLGLLSTVAVDDQSGFFVEWQQPADGVGDR